MSWVTDTAAFEYDTEMAYSNHNFDKGRYYDTTDPELYMTNSDGSSTGRSMYNGGSWTRNTSVDA